MPLDIKQSANQCFPMKGGVNKMTKGVLVDIPKCIGCGSCTVACKLWNQVDFDEKHPAIGKGAALNDKNWTIVTSCEVVDNNNSPAWRFTKQQCLHCQQPACVSACFSKALQKTNEGAVVYYPHLCVGCRYCMVACPFDIPRYEWDKTFPLVTKCQMCSTRIVRGEAPACVCVCPTGAMEFGERDFLLEKAHTKIAKDSSYRKNIYGEKEIGGTSWLYISDIAFHKLGFKTDIGNDALPMYSHNYLKYIPGIALVWGMLLTGLYYYGKRKKELLTEGKELKSSSKDKKQGKMEDIGGRKNEK
jgi:formate dehydrogenase iron-sulfur subunit